MDNYSRKLSPKQMLQRFPIALAQVKACNTSKILFNKIWQVVKSFYRAKEIKYIYNNVINSMQILSYKIGTIFVNPENSKNPDPQKQILNFTDEINS